MTDYIRMCFNSLACAASGYALSGREIRESATALYGKTGAFASVVGLDKVQDDQHYTLLETVDKDGCSWYSVKGV